MFQRNCYFGLISVCIKFLKRSGSGKHRSYTRLDAKTSTEKAVILCVSYISLLLFSIMFYKVVLVIRIRRSHSSRQRARFLDHLQTTQFI